MKAGGKPPGRGRKPKAGLTVEEQDLWDHAAASMKPLRRAKGRILDGADEAVFEPVEVTPKRRVKAAIQTPPKHPVPVIPPAVPAKPISRTPDLADFDRKSARRLRSGQIEIDARLDLHGMHQAEAHAALRRFLFSCHANGARWVLVITGKGAPRRSGWFSDSGDPVSFAAQRSAMARGCRSARHRCQSHAGSHFAWRRGRNLCAASSAWMIGKTGSNTCQLRAVLTTDDAVVAVAFVIFGGAGGADRAGRFQLRAE
jgi:DNA-nicking Smr family endonuclease